MNTFKQSLYLILAFTVFNFGSANPLSLGSASDNVTDTKRIEKRAANPKISGDVFPDWVPFKNKHGEELGEFVPVPKAKPKKRLALPMNFKLRPVAAPQDDYFDKVQADGEGETEYFENKDWNGQTGAGLENKDEKTNPTAEAKEVATSTTTENNVRQKHKDISDIDGVVSIIQSLDPSRVAIEQNIITTVSPTRYPKYGKESKKEVESSEDVKVEDNNEEDSDEEESKKNHSKEEKNSAAKKAFILNSVDELKERHASEQKYISEKAKEEERFIEQLERDTIWAKHHKKHNKPKEVVEVHYHDDYDDDEKSVEDKYKIKPRLTTTTPTTTTTHKKTTSTTRVISPRKKEPETAKQSVFRNPRLYMIYQEDETESPHRKNATRRQHTKTTTTTSTLRTPKFSSRYVYSPSSSSEDNESESKKDETEEVERLAFVPEKNSDNGEPTLFFVKRLRSRKSKTTTTTAQPNTESDQATNGTETAVADATASGSANTVSNTIPNGFFTSPNSDSTGTTANAAEITSPSAADNTNSTATLAVSSASAASAPDTTSSASKTSAASTGPSSSDTTAPSGVSEEVSATGEESAPTAPTGPIDNSIEILDVTTTERVRKITYGRDKTTTKDRKLNSDVKNAKLTADLDASSTNKHKKEDIKDAGGNHEHESGKLMVLRFLVTNKID